MSIGRRVLAFPAQCAAAGVAGVQLFVTGLVIGQWLWRLRHGHLPWRRHGAGRR